MQPTAEQMDVRQRCEVVAALCVAAALAVLLHGVSRAVAYGRLDERMTGGLSAWQLVEVAAGSSTIFGSQEAHGVTGVAVLVLAYLLVAVIPTGPVGRIGARALEALVGVGALLALAGAIATVAVLRREGPLEAGLASPFDPQAKDDDIVLTIADRGGPALLMLAGAVVAGYVAWSAYQALLPVALAELDEDDEDEHDLDDQDDRDHDPYGADED